MQFFCQFACICHCGMMLFIRMKNNLLRSPDKMLHAITMCCSLQTVFHMDYMAHHRNTVSFSPLPSSMQKPNCFAFVDWISKNVTFLDKMLTDSSSATGMRCSRFPINATSFFCRSFTARFFSSSINSSCA